jgi:hypothetical protein
MFNRELRTPDMERTTTGQVSGEDTPLARRLSRDAGDLRGGLARPSAEGHSPTAIRQDFDGTTGTPVAYALVSGGIRLVPPPSSSDPADDGLFRADRCRCRFTAPSNWLLEKHPDAYLYGTLFNAEALSRQCDRAAQWKGLLDEVIDGSTARPATTATAPGRWFRTSPARSAGASC